MDAYSIGPADSADVPFLAGVERAAASIFPAGALPDGCADDAVPENILREACAEGRLWVAKKGGRPVGFLLLEIVEGESLVAEVDVHPDHGRRGLGGRLVDRAMAYARDHGHPALYLTTFRGVPWNAPFYARLGFAVLGEGESPPFIQAILADERERGFTGRVAMRWSVPERDPEERLI